MSHVLETGRGPLDIPTRDELSAWSRERCLRWLARNDPDGTWYEHLTDPVWAAEEYGDLDDDEIRDMVWEMVEEGRPYPWEAQQ